MEQTVRWGGVFFCCMGMRFGGIFTLVERLGGILHLAFAEGIPILLESTQNYHEHADSLCWHLPASFHARFPTPALKLPGKDAIADLSVASGRVTGRGCMIGSRLLPKDVGGSTTPELEDLACAAPCSNTNTIRGHTYQQTQLSHERFHVNSPPTLPNNRTSRPVPHPQHQQPP